MSQGLYSHTTRSVGTVLTASIYNSDHTNHITNHNPSQMGGYSDTVGEMQNMADPGGVGTESLSASLADELDRLRFVIDRIVGGAQWYSAPGFDLSDADISSFTGLSPVNDDFLQRKAGAWANRTPAQIVEDIAASTTQKGTLEIATEVEAAARADTGRAITPFNNPLPPGYLFGLDISNNATDATNDIDISSGKARDSTDIVNMIRTATLTKRLDAAWAVGTNQGGLDTGAVANGTYHIWLIKRSDTGVVDALFSLSATAPTMPTNYDFKRRIGSILRESAAIVPFTKDGDDFRRKTPVTDITAVNPGITAVTRTLSVPSGLRIRALVAHGIFDDTGAEGSPSFGLLSDLTAADVAPSGSIADVIASSAGNVNANAIGMTSVWTNTSRQIRSRISFSDVDVTETITTFGWTDLRGRV